MSAAYHPDWCSRAACTAYGVEGDKDHRFERLHRSEPLVVTTDDPTASLFMHKFADPDGTGEHIELVMLALPIGRPWYLSEPILGRELLLPRASADAVRRAMAELI